LAFTNITDATRVENGSYNGKKKNSAKVVEKGSVRHEKASIKYDGGQHTEKEDG
jgi:hypothetical protein